MKNLLFGIVLLGSVLQAQESFKSFDNTKIAFNLSSI